MLLLTGVALLALGLFCGGALLMGPFGVLPGDPGAALWILFPALLVMGYVLFVVPARLAQIRAVSRLACSLLLLLALGAAVGLVMVSASLVAPVAGTGALWYVLTIGLLLGSLGILAPGPQADHD